MGGGWLRAIGDAGPTIRAVYKDIEANAREMRERPIREEAQRLELQTRRNALATGNIQLEQLKRTEADAKAKYLAGEQLVDIAQTEQFKAVPVTIQREFLNMGRSMKLIPQDSTMVKQKDIEPLVSQAERNREQFKKLSGMAKDELFEKVNVAKVAYDQARKTGNLEKLPAAKAAWERATMALEDADKATAAQMKWIIAKDSINEQLTEMMKDPNYQKLPPTVKAQMESFYDTGDLAQWNNAMEKINPILMKAQQPSSNIAKPSPRDFTPESLDKYSRSGNMNDLVRVEGAGKSVQTHFETDEKGNTTKIVTDPSTGKTIAKENMGKVGKPFKEPDVDKEKRLIGKDTAYLRKEFDQLKEVKDYKDVRSKIQVMEKALAGSKGAGSKVATDQALITLYNKMTDPQSVVRESEYARTPEDMSLLNRIAGKIQKIRSGGAGLTDEERTALVRMAREFYTVYNGLYNQQVENYRGYAEKSGLDPDMVIKGEGKKDSLGIR